MEGVVTVVILQLVFMAKQEFEPWSLESYIDTLIMRCIEFWIQLVGRV